MPDLYLGRTLSDGKPLLLSSADLVTHGVCVGMTGSGKTGLCIGLLEELLLADVPLFLLDPKGDVTNLLLAFPDLAPEDFAPWIDPESARRAGRSIEEEASSQAALWKEGLAKWNVPLESLRRLREGVDWRLFTPGSRAARPVNLLGSLDAPAGLSWETDEETLRDELRGLVGGLLTLAGVEADSVRDPRSILLQRVVEARWREAQPLDLPGLLALTENPPFARVGAMELDLFLPREKRRELALALNNLLAAPEFETWRSGDPLAPASLARDGSGRPGCNLFYLAHLDDRERMFFVSRFLERLWSWVRTQSGTAQLRALLYFDEVSGYLPPVAEPASKRPLLSILKQGRGFGFGALLATQNPVDLDYKALTNAGIWMIGRLQAQRDKDRLLDGLESAGVGLLRAELDRTISGLEKRRFLLHDVHRPGGPVVFESRWVRAYLRGPVSLRELPQLTGEPAAAAPPAARAAASSFAPSAPVPPSLDPVFQHRYSGRGTGAPLAGEVAAWMEARVSRQRPAVAGVARVLVRFGRGPAPQPVLDRETDPESWSSSPPGGAAYGALPAWATAGSSTAGLERLARNAVAGEGLTLDGVPALGLVRAPEEAAEAFAARVRAALGAEAQKRSAKTRGPAARKIETLERRIAEEARELERDRGELSRAKTYSAIDVGASILGTVLGGGKRSVGTAGRAGGRAYGRIQRASEGVKESEQKIAEWTSERDALRSQLEAELAAVRRELEAEAGKVEPVRVPITRADVRALGWYVLWS